MAQRSRRKLSFEMPDQISQGPAPYIAIARNSQVSGRFAQQVTDPTAVLFRDLCAGQSQHRAHFLDILTRAMNRFGAVALPQTFERILDSLATQTPNPFRH